MLVVRLVLSRLDFGNAVLVGIPVYLVHRLQSVLNAPARLIYRLKRSDHYWRLGSLHWLRVSERIQYKVAVLTYKVVHDTAPRSLDHSVEWLIYLVVGHYVLPAPVAWWCRRSGCLRSVVGPSMFLLREYEMRWTWRRCFCSVTINIRASTQNVPLPSIIPGSSHLTVHLAP